ncbi:MAG: glutamine-hydrolyzing GMP synthase [Patescibacteria group bacterium]|jgi:GMP synthase (glutamine-hydrolysing)
MQHIAILDYGSQYTHLISRAVRELEVLANIYPSDTPAGELGDAAGIILSGGPQAVYAENAILVDPEIFNLGKPVLGVCYGHQLLGHMLGGVVEAAEFRDGGEFGLAKIKITNDSPIFKGVSESSTVWMSHGDAVIKLPKGFSVIAKTSDCPIAAMENAEKKFYGFQFHPEVVHSEEGHKMIANFVLNICEAEKNWRIDDLLEHLIKKIKNQVKDKKVFILVSGGIDSTVAFVLLTRALGEKKVKGLYVNTGFMRKEETEEVVKGFKNAGMNNLKTVDAGETFYGRLVNKFEPEEKRRIIGETFIDVKEDIAAKLNLDSGDWLLGQGTIYPDTITSGGTKNAEKIKTHHNRVDRIKKLVEAGLVIEPLIDFYKDEVRKIGALLNIPEDQLKRHPFPGPGLAVRCLCAKAGLKAEAVSELNEKAEKLLRAVAPDIECRALPIKSVGVQGDQRTYAHPLTLWNKNKNAFSASAAEWDKLDEIASAATNKIRKLNRVMLLLNPEKLREEENEFSYSDKNLYLTRERIEVLREMDAIVHDILREEKIYDDIWECPVVLIPVLDKAGRESVVIRPLNSRDVMTLRFYRMEKRILEKITKAILATGKISYVFYDLTNKPPATLEWE